MNNQNKNKSNITAPHTQGASVSTPAVILTGVKIFLFASSSLLFLSAYQPVLAASLRGQELEIVRLTNQIRQAQGISMLAVSPELTASAIAKANDMATNNYFGHADKNGNRMAYWISAAGYAYLRAGENLAKGFTNPEDLVQAWVGSPTHYANLINYRYRDVGIGMAEGYIDGHLATFVVQHFGEPMPVPNIFPIGISRLTTNVAPRVLGDQSNLTPIGDITAETMTEISPSGATAVNQSPVGLWWVAYQEAGDIMHQPILPVSLAAGVADVDSSNKGYQAAQILFVVLALIGLWGWLYMLMWPIYSWLGKLKKRST